jgi:hypothetical protein
LHKKLLLTIQLDSQEEFANTQIGDTIRD